MPTLIYRLYLESSVKLVTARLSRDGNTSKWRQSDQTSTTVRQNVDSHLSKRKSLVKIVIVWSMVMASMIAPRFGNCPKWYIDPLFPILDMKTITTRAARVDF